MKAVEEKTKQKKFTLLDESKKSFESQFYDSYFIHEYGKLENARSERYSNAYSLILLSVHGFDKGKTTPTKDKLMEFLRHLITTTLTVVRNCDITGLLENKHIVVILPQTDYFGCLTTIKKLTRALEPFTTKGEPYASIIVSQATYPRDAKGFGELLSTATRRIGEIQGSIWETMEFKEKLFWEIMASLTIGGLNGEKHASFDVGGDGDLSNEFLSRVNEVIIEEIARTPESPGILYIGAKKITEDLSIIKPLNMLGSTRTKIFVVGEGKESAVEFKNATAINLDDNRLSEYYFSFFISENSAYALICKESWGESHMCFHCSDPYLVEGLITKFQRDYHLQEQL